jgi:hypothetical protein
MGTSEYNLVVGGFVVLVAKDQISNFVMYVVLGLFFVAYNGNL